MNETTMMGGSPMEKIDGARIRRLREEKGLTQLYMATAVGVTADTISRWENRRYPSIKKENALKLAEALEVPLLEILEQQVPEDFPTPDQQDESSPPVQVMVTKDRKWLSYGVLTLLVVFLLAFLFWQSSTQEQPILISARRLLPDHIPGGQKFPVMISVTFPTEMKPFSFMLKEKLPDGCTAVAADPPFSSYDRKNGIIKWINKTDDGIDRFSYQVQVSPKLKNGGLFTFQGSITPGKVKGAKNETAGPNNISINPYHWADVNLDTMIDDEEILAVYDTYSIIEDLVDMNLVEEIWSGQGYRFDQNSLKYVVIP